MTKPKTEPDAFTFSLEAKWKWARERFPDVKVTTDEQKEILEMLKYLQKRAEGFKQKCIELMKENQK